MRFTSQLDIINHHDINILSFYNDQDINFIINVYSDSNQTTLQFLSQNIVNLNNTIIMTSNFNIRVSWLGKTAKVIIYIYFIFLFFFFYLGLTT